MSLSGLGNTCCCGNCECGHLVTKWNNVTKVFDWHVDSSCNPTDPAGITPYPRPVKNQIEKDGDGNCVGVTLGDCWECPGSPPIIQPKCDNLGLDLLEGAANDDTHASFPATGTGLTLPAWDSYENLRPNYYEKSEPEAQTNFTKCRRLGFKNVQAKKIHHGAKSFLSRDLAHPDRLTGLQRPADYGTATGANVPVPELDCSCNFETYPGSPDTNRWLKLDMDIYRDTVHGWDVSEENDCTGLQELIAAFTYYTITKSVLAGKTYTYTKGNSTDLVNGTQTLTASGDFVAQGTSIVLHGPGGTVATAQVSRPIKLGNYHHPNNLPGVFDPDETPTVHIERHVTVNRLSGVRTQSFDGIDCETERGIDDTFYLARIAGIEFKTMKDLVADFIAIVNQYRIGGSHAGEGLILHFDTNADFTQVEVTVESALNSHLLIRKFGINTGGWFYDSTSEITDPNDGKWQSISNDVVTDHWDFIPKSEKRYEVWTDGTGHPRLRYYERTFGEWTIANWYDTSDSLCTPSPPFGGADGYHELNRPWFVGGEEDSPQFRVEMELSEPYTTDEVYSDLKDLLATWNLSDDAQCPIRKDGYVTIAPLVTRDEWPTPASPLNFSACGIQVWCSSDPEDFLWLPWIEQGYYDFNEQPPADSSFARDPDYIANGYIAKPPRYSGLIVGAPMPAGYDSFFDPWHKTWEKIDCSPPQFSPKLMGAWSGDDTATSEPTDALVPKSATQWTENYQGGGLTAGAWLYNGEGVLRGQKWLEVKLPWAAHNYFRPAGEDRYLVLKDSTFCVTGETELTATDLASGESYDVAGSVSIDVVAGTICKWTKGNATNLTNGTEVLTADGEFTAQRAAVVLTGPPSTSVSATVRQTSYRLTADNTLAVDDAVLFFRTAWEETLFYVGKVTAQDPSYVDLSEIRLAPIHYPVNTDAAYLDLIDPDDDGPRPWVAKLKFPNAWAIEGSVAITSATQNGVSVDIVCAAVPWLRTGDKVKFVQADLTDTLLDDHAGAGYPVTVIDPTHFSFVGTRDGTNHTQSVMSLGAPLSKYNTATPTGNYVLFEWTNYFRDYQYFDQLCDDTATCSICVAEPGVTDVIPELESGDSCISVLGDPQSDIRWNQEQNGVHRAVASMSVGDHTLEQVECYPSVIIISPDGQDLGDEEFELRANHHDFPATYTMDERYFQDKSQAVTWPGGWLCYPVQAVPDPLWEDPPKPCGLEAISIQCPFIYEPSGECLPNVACDPTGTPVSYGPWYFAHPRMVEARSRDSYDALVVVGTPALPSGCHVGWITLLEVQASVPPSVVGNIAKPNEPIGAEADYGEAVEVITTWTLWRAMEACACALGRWAARHLLNGIDCSDRRNSP